LKERFSRLNTIKQIIKNNRVSSQEALLKYLQAEGINVTQATLSRDLKVLKVGKISAGKSGYYYSLPGQQSEKDTDNIYKQDLIRGYLSLEFSKNLGIVTTLPGHANSVAIALENLDYPEIIGTLAGDDTVLLIISEEAQLEQIRHKLHTIMPENLGDIK
jgi:transcriptional regulator of arginine metabolism